MRESKLNTTYEVHELSYLREFSKWDREQYLTYWKLLATFDAILNS